jgi:DNA primase
VPFSDAPAYEAVRAWLHPFVERAVANHPALLVGERHTHEVFTAARIQCTFVSNAVCLHSSLPYALNGTPDLPMVTPIDWNELPFAMPSRRMVAVLRGLPSSKIASTAAMLVLARTSMC